MNTDILIVGDGIAGMALAGRLAGRASAVLVEREPFLGVHASGHSVASFLESYGNDSVRALARSSRAFFEAPPRRFTEQPLWKPLPMLLVARKSHLELAWCSR